MVARKASRALGLGAAAEKGGREEGARRREPDERSEEGDWPVESDARVRRGVEGEPC